MNGVELQSYLADVLTRHVDHPNSRIDGLLPWSEGVDRARFCNARRTRVLTAGPLSLRPADSGCRRGASKPSGHGLITFVADLAKARSDDAEALTAMLLAERAR